MNVEVTPGHLQEEDYPLSEIRSGQVGILTRSDGVSKPGDVVVGAVDYVVFPRTQTNCEKTHDGYRWRKLRPGEVVKISK